MLVALQLPYKIREGNLANNVELWQTFRRINAQAKTVFFLVDGFDECEKEDANLPKHSLLDAKTTFLTRLNEAVDALELVS